MQEEFTKEVADKLKIVPDAARSLLSAYGWSRDLLYSAWEQDNKATCAKAGLELSRVQINDDGNELFTSFSSKSCEICFITIPHHDRIEVPCNHYFCRECWASYVQVSVAEGGGKDILCPGHDCSQPVPRDVLAKLVNEELFKKYSDLNIKHFVDSCKDFKWCPFPDCNQAVMKKDGRTTAPELGQRHGINVECGNGHGFCWNCNKHAHEPCECEVWEIWLNEISKMVVKPKLDLKEVADQAEADAQWIINNTKPCPSCNSPIQKNEGCNHMTCRTVSGSSGGCV
jgi:ankyrin repeat/IBR domain-containing protein 1